MWLTTLSAAAGSARKAPHPGKVCGLCGRRLLRGGRAEKPQHQWQPAQACRTGPGVTYTFSCSGMCSTIPRGCYVFFLQRRALHDSLMADVCDLHVQGELTLLVRDYAGNPVEPSSVTGSIRQGKGGGGGDLTFVSQGQGAYTASVSGLGLGMGNHQCALYVVPAVVCHAVGHSCRQAHLCHSP